MPRAIHENPLQLLIHNRKLGARNWEKSIQSNWIWATWLRRRTGGNENLCTVELYVATSLYSRHCYAAVLVKLWAMEKLAHQIANEIPSSTTALAGSNNGQRSNVEMHRLRAVSNVGNSNGIQFCCTVKSGFKAHMPLHGSIRIYATKLKRLNDAASCSCAGLLDLWLCICFALGCKHFYSDFWSSEIFVGELVSACIEL